MGYSIDYIYRLTDQFSGNAKALYSTATKAAEGARQLGQAAVSAQRGVESVGRAALASTGHVKGLTSAMQKMSAVRSVNGGMLAAGGLAPSMMPVVSAVKTYMSFEDKAFDIKKVFEGTEGEWKQLMSRVDGLSNWIPLKRTEIAKLTEDALKAGIGNGMTGKAQIDEVIGYTELAAKFAIAFSLPLEQASEKLAMMKSSLNLSLPALEAFGDTMNTLANRMTTSESKLLEFSKRVGPLAKSIGGEKGLYAALAVGAAQTSAGIDAGVAGTGFRTMLARLSQMGKPTRSALKMLGLDPDTIKKQLPDDIMGTMKTIMGRVAALPKADQAGILANLAGMRAFDAFAPLLANLALLDEAQKNAFGPDKVKLSDEFAQRIKTMSAAFQLTKNSIDQMTDSFVEAWEPQIKWLNIKMREFAAYLKGNPVAAWAVGLLGLASVIGIVLVPIAMLAFALKSLGIASFIAVGFRLLSVAVLGAGGGLAMIATRMFAFARAAGVIGTIGAIIRVGLIAAFGPLGLLATVLYLIWANWDRVKVAAQSAMDVMSDVWSGIGDAWEGSQLQQALQGLLGILSGIWDKIVLVKSGIAAALNWGAGPEAKGGQHPPGAPVPRDGNIGKAVGWTLMNPLVPFQVAGAVVQNLIAGSSGAKADGGKMQVDSNVTVTAPSVVRLELAPGGGAFGTLQLGTSASRGENMPEQVGFPVP
jgi:TP901 family phage tail tape measure protein